MAKQNNLWKLDLLEVEFLKTEPRFPKSKLLLKSKRKSSLIPNNKNQALKEIDSLRQDVFNKKLHSSLVKYRRELKKITKAAPSKKTSEAEAKFIKELDTERVTNIKIVKLIQNIFKLIPKKLQNEPERIPKYIPSWVVEGITEKESVNNQACFYNSLSQDEKNYYSKIMNHKQLLQIVKIIENSFKIVLGPVKDKEKKDIEEVETSDSESEHEKEEASDDDDEEEDEQVESKEATEEFNSDDDFSQYDAMVAGSEDEEEVELDNEINYNSVTDEEPSDDEEEKSEEESEHDDFFEEEPKKSKNEKESKKKEEKYKLPELTGGYFSGGSDEEIESDAEVERIIKPQKKNRRGQRARQKIWEAKFRNNANHIKKEREEAFKAREKRQKEYEERVAKRAAKAQELTGSNSAPLTKQREFNKNAKMPEPLPHVAKPVGEAVEKETKLHPSWEAKKRQEEALKNVKFQGKKVKF